MEHMVRLWLPAKPVKAAAAVTRVGAQILIYNMDDSITLQRPRFWRFVCEAVNVKSIGYSFAIMLAVTCKIKIFTSK